MAATDTEILARLRLIKTEGIGPVTFYKLLKTYRSAKEALQSLPPKYRPAPLSDAERELSLVKTKGIKLIAFDNPEYPQKLREIEDAPPFLWVKGRTDILNLTPAVSIVGAGYLFGNIPFIKENLSLILLLGIVAAIVGPIIVGFIWRWLQNRKMKE